MLAYQQVPRAYRNPFWKHNVKTIISLKTKLKIAEKEKNIKIAKPNHWAIHIFFQNVVTTSGLAQMFKMECTGYPKKTASLENKYLLLKNLQSPK